jgi:AraC-like DNA-binding protein
MPITNHYRIKPLENLELLHTQHVTDGYEKHLHEEYSICWMQTGLVTTHYRGSSHLSPVQSLTVMNPAELHRGKVIGEESVSYYSLYPSENTLRQVCEEVFETSTLPYFQHPIVLDNILEDKLRAFVISLQNVHSGQASSLELSSHYLSFLAQLVKHYADTTFTLASIKQEASAVEKARQYLHANFHKDVTLHELANVVSLNRAYLIRAFKKTVGLPPHAYLTQLRLIEAKKQLVAGTPIIQVALKTGFADQSHFSRTFKYTYGVTPATYAKAKFIDEGRQL